MSIFPAIKIAGKLATMIIGIVNTKGGVGKTTTAIYLASALERDGYSVVVYDLDQQGSASDWADRAEDSGEPMPFKVEISNARRLERSLLQAGEKTVVILDTPPGENKAIEAAIKLSDFVVVPTQASAIEIARVWETLPSLVNVPHGVLITSARLGTKHLTDAQEVLSMNKIPTFDTLIPIRNDIRDHYGRVPDELHGYNSVIQEIKKVVSWH